MGQDRIDVRGDDRLAVSQADDQRGAHLRRDDPAGILDRDGPDGESALHLGQGRPDGLLQRSGEMLLDQVGDDFGVGLRPEDMTLGLQLCLQGEIILDDAVVDDDDPARAVDVGMSVGFAWAPMGRPPGMTEAVGALDRRAAQALLQSGDLAPDPAKADASTAGDGHSGRVVSAVFKLFQALEQNGDDVFRADIPDDSAHANPLPRGGSSPARDGRARTSIRRFSPPEASPSGPPPIRASRPAGPGRRPGRRRRRPW